MNKRKDYISWDEYFMGVAQLSGMRSKDPSTQVGACIVSRDNKILSMGYNGFPSGCDDDEFPWDREGEELDRGIVVSGEVGIATLSHGGEENLILLEVGGFHDHLCAI